MKRDEILKMEAGRELDALVAEKVMGYEDMGIGIGLRFQKPSQTGVKVLYELPSYSTRIAAAWEVVEKLREQFIAVTITTMGPRDQVHVFTTHNGERMTKVWDDTAPLAICRAALLMEVKK